MWEKIFTIFLGLFAGIFYIRLGLQGRKDKIERESDMSRPADELLGAYEGSVQNHWYIYVSTGTVALLITILSVIKAIYSLIFN